jgi:hypothetical protein
MHPNTQLLQRFFTALNDHDHEARACYYPPRATFRDIAFDLDRVTRIHGMWFMICDGE